MPSKKKKFSARFPPARIKKIMQTDEDVGKVAAAVPVLISRALEKFIETLILKTSETTKIRNAKTLTTSHIKQTIHQEKKFDFLKDLVANVPDHQAEDESDPNISDTKRQKTPRPRKQRTEGRKKRKKNSSDSNSEEEANDNGSSTETDEEVAQHEQLSAMSAAASNEQHQGIPSSSYPNPVISGENPEAMMSYPSTSSMPSHPGYPPPGCYSPQGIPGLPPQGMHNPYSMQMNNHMPQQTQPLNLCNASYNPSMYMPPGYPYPQSLGYPYPPHMNPGAPSHDSHQGMNHLATMPGPSHLPAFSKAPPPSDQGQDLSLSRVNPVAQNAATPPKQAQPTSTEDDDYDA